MTVDISKFDMATPLPTSATNPVALELNGDKALAQCPTVIIRLTDGSIQLTAPTKGASSKMHTSNSMRMERVNLLDATQCC
jgi:hypothetical protein